MFCGNPELQLWGRFYQVYHRGLLGSGGVFGWIGLKSKAVPQEAYQGEPETDYTGNNSQTDPQQTLR